MLTVCGAGEPLSLFLTDLGVLGPIKAAMGGVQTRAADPALLVWLNLRRTRAGIPRECLYLDGIVG